jgi:hypothetical protein
MIANLIRFWKNTYRGSMGFDSGMYMGTVNLLL